MALKRLLKKWTRLFGRLSLSGKIYTSLAGILLPVFAITLFVQTQVTTPLLEEEVRQYSLSFCKSVATEILAFHLLNKPDQLDARLTEMTYPQPNVARVDVIVSENGVYKVIASNIVEDNPTDFSTLTFSDNPVIDLKEESDRRYFQVVYPIRDVRHTIGWIHAEVSLQLVHRVVSTFSRIAFFGALLSILLLISLLSFYLKHLIESERKLVALEAELHETQRQLFLKEKLAVMGQLTASIAHEIGTPLNSLAGHLELLRDEVTQKQSQERIDIINSQVQRIEGTVKEFLASTHTPALQQKELVDIEAAINRIVRLISPRLHSIRAEVKVELAEKLEPIRIVPIDLEQVLLNLANNAIDALESAAGPARELLLRARMTEDQKALAITVADTGSGIPPETLRQVTKPFFSTKAPGQGTGLGLTICQRLVKKYGGKLELESQLGKGTLITVTIPYA